MNLKNNILNFRAYLSKAYAMKDKPMGIMRNPYASHVWKGIIKTYIIWFKKQPFPGCFLIYFNKGEV